MQKNSKIATFLQYKVCLRVLEANMSLITDSMIYKWLLYMNCYIYVNSYLVLSIFYQDPPADCAVGFVNSVFVETKK